ncbi:glycosyltransferase [uncultured Rubinisphaera sp.]|uniref:glycosyltransferase n=1 Tax=uncultured Rubinisphaera sp. TaxID=1678686 RepID=UPI0030D89642
MNILFLSSIFPDAQNPSRGTFNYETCCALKRAGANVRVISPQAWTEVIKSRTKTEPTEGLVHQQIQVEYPTYWYPPKILRSQYGHFYWKSIQKSLEKVLTNWDPDFVLSYWAHPDGDAGLRLAEAINKPCGVIIGGSDVLILPKESGRRKPIVRVLQHSDLVLTVSQGLANVVESYDVPAERVVPVYQGVDIEHFKPADKEQARVWLGMDPARPLLLWVGRMVGVKNLEMLIAAAEMKANRGDDFVLCLAGDGPLRGHLEKVIQQKDLEGIVSLVGSVGHQDLPTWYQAADVTLLCSHSEGLPNVFRESLACGTPFVSTDVGSISEIANPKYSMLVESGDVNGFVHAIDEVLQGPHQENAEQAPVRSWDDMAEEILELAESLPDSHGVSNSISMVSDTD